MEKDRSTAVAAACFAVAALVVFGTLNSYEVSARTAGQYTDPFGIARAQQRFAPVLQQVPASAKLGYITDLEPSHQSYSTAFLAVQYALAPRQLLVLAPGGERPDWAVGNFSRPQDFAAAAAPHGYELAADFGTGAVLFRPTRRQ